MEQSETSQQTIAERFLADHPDFPGGETNARERVEQLVGSGYPFVPETLNMAYWKLEREGAIQPHTQPALDPGDTEQAHLSDAEKVARINDEYHREHAHQYYDETLEKILRDKGALIGPSSYGRLAFSLLSSTRRRSPVAITPSLPRARRRLSRCLS